LFLYCFLRLCLSRDRVVMDMASVAMVWFCKSERICGSFTRKGGLISNVVLLPERVVHSSLWFRLGWCFNALCFSDAPGLLRYAGLKALGLSPFWLCLLIRLSSCDCVWIVILERVIMPAALFRGLLVLGSFRVDGCSIRLLNPFLF
jgi:hypothetical protein